MNRPWLSKYGPFLFILGVALFFLREPILFGKSFCVVDVGEFEPWASVVGPSHGPGNQSCHDQVFAYYVRKFQYREALLDGRLPGWDNRMMGGYPIEADMQVGWYDPFNLLFLVFDIPAGMKILGFLQVLLAGLFSYLFLREIRLVKPASMLGATAFMMQPFFITRLPWPPAIQSAIWLPCLMWLTERYLKSDSPARYVLPMGAVVALCILGGFPPVFILGLGAWFAYTVVRILFQGRNDGLERTTGRRKLSLAIMPAVAVTIGTMISSPQLLPTLKVAEYSKRSVIPYDVQKEIALPVEFLATLANPFIFGRPTDEEWSGVAKNAGHDASDWVSSTSFLEDNHYVGWIVMLLAIWAIRFRFRDVRVIAITAIAGLSLLTLYGSPTLWLAYHLVPGFKATRMDRIVFLWGSFMAFLSAVGLNDLLDKKKPGNHLGSLMLGGAIIFAVIASIFSYLIFFFLSDGVVPGGLYPWVGNSLVAVMIAGVSAFFLIRLAKAGEKKTNLFVSAVIILTFLDLGRVAGSFLLFQPRFYPARQSPAVACLDENLHGRRIARLGAVMSVYPSNAPVLEGIADVQGRMALLLEHWGKYMDAIEPGTFWRGKRVISFRGRKPVYERELLMDAAGIKYLLTNLPPYEIDNRPELLQSNHKAPYIYENPGVYPEAWFVPEVIRAGKEQQAITAIKARNFDPSKTVIIESKTDVPDVDSGSDVGTARVDRISPEEVEIHINGGAGGWLVFADTWYPNWTAEVDGEPRRVYKADVAFMAVAVSPGEKTVRFEYRNGTRGVTWLAALAGVFIGVLSCRINPGRKRQDESSS